MQEAKKGQQQLSETVATYLREQIISGTLTKGAFLRIDAIALTLGVSTTPVREGLLILQSEALVKLIPRRGFVVTSFGKEDLLDLFWAQATVGAELAARATLRMSDADIAKLLDLHAKHEQSVIDGDRIESEYLGHQFHRAINLAADSPRLALLMGSLTKQLPNRFYTNIEGQLKDAVEYHPVIVDAIRLRDQDAVRALMFRHILNGGQNLIAALERQGLWDGEGGVPDDTSIDAASKTPTDTSVDKSTYAKNGKPKLRRARAKQ